MKITEWTGNLVCPTCKSKLELGSYEKIGFSPSLYLLLKCSTCGVQYPIIHEIPVLFDMKILDDPKYTDEIGRYNEISAQGYHKYSGLQDTHPEARAKLVSDILRKESIKEYVNIGPGFGFLEYLTGDIESYAVDEAVGFLVYVHGISSRVKLINAFAEYLPFGNNSIECLVTDSTFQSITDRERFLLEIQRILAPGGLLILSIAYGWNYPRKDQDGYNVNEESQLKDLFNRVGYLDKLEWKFWDSNSESWVKSKEEGNYLWIIGRKRSG